MNRRYFVDTSVIVGYLRGQASAVKLIESLDGELSSSYICLSELYEGIYRVKDKTKAETGVRAFFNGLNDIFGLNKEIAESFGQIRSSLKSQSRVIEDIDIIIAATCLAENLTLVTHNRKHFSGIKGLEVFT